LPTLTKEDYDGVIDTDGCHDSPGDDYDGDALTDEDEVFVHGTHPQRRDTDGDTCGDGAELGTQPSHGGDRDPKLADFYDVTGDGAIDLRDALEVLDRFGALPGEAEYDPLFDRYAPDASKPWRTAAAVGEHVGIDLQDALVNLQSFGHSCAGAP
jgi:hypothetical protein